MPAKGLIKIFWFVVYRPKKKLPPVQQNEQEVFY